MNINNILLYTDKHDTRSFIKFSTIYVSFGSQMIVDEMNILTTVFLRKDHQKIIYPNSILATKPIGNYQRSPHMVDAIDFCIHVSTPLDKVSTMKERITRYEAASIFPFFFSYSIDLHSSLVHLNSRDLEY